MSYRILRIRGRQEATRRSRLSTAEQWMAARGWRLVDYSESTRQALFEPSQDVAAARPEGLPPGYWRGLWEEWTAPKRLVLVLGSTVVLAGLFLFNAWQSRFDAGTAANEADERWWTVTADRVNVRDSPGADGQIVARLHKGQRVLVVNVDGEWAEVAQPERGYLSTQFLRAPGGGE